MKGGNEAVIWIDCWCRDLSDTNCTLMFRKGDSLTKTFRLSDIPAPADAKSYYCAADCDTTARALQAAEESCKQDYNAVLHSCRDVVDTALKTAGCPTLPLSRKLRLR